MIVAYDGTRYCGWQIQPNGITIEAVLNQTLAELIGEEIKVAGASRTDSGVHALGNVAVFDTDSNIPSERMMYALNQKLPADIRIMNSEEVPADWHPRFQKSIKTYEYRLETGTVPNPLQRFTHYFVTQPLDFMAMEEAVTYLVGEHDFVGFTREECQGKHTIRKIYSATLLRADTEILFQIRGNGFLYNMVRMIMGALLEIGKGRFPPVYIQEVLKGESKEVVKVTAPPQGLVLVNIEYIK